MHSQTGEICCFTVLGLIDPALCTYVFDILDFSAKCKISTAFPICSATKWRCENCEPRVNWKTELSPLRETNPIQSSIQTPSITYISSYVES